jgi:glutathione synthase/RimK-type ligase-like ATP-grasp enzyme
MLKKLIIASESKNLYTTKRLLDEGTKLKRSTTWINPYEEHLSCGEINKEPGTYLFRTTGIRYDDFDLLCAKNYSLENYKIVNPLQALNVFRSKDNQALFFKEHSIQGIPSFIYRGSLTEEKWNELLTLSPTGDYILKMSKGNQGIGVNFIQGTQSLKSFLETFQAMKDQRFLIQPFIPHKKELRVFIINNEIHAIVERTLTKDDFRGNAKRSIGKIIKKIPSLLRDEIERAFLLSGLSYCGIDLLMSDEGYKFIEINPVPGFEQVELLTQKNIAKEILTQLE